MQCDQMARLYFNLWPITTVKLFPNAYKNLQKHVKVGAYTKQGLKIDQRRLKLSQIGEISPNQVTLYACHKMGLVITNTQTLAGDIFHSFIIKIHIFPGKVI